MKPDNTVGRVQVVCNGCQATFELPAQSSIRKVQISFKASLHKTLRRDGIVCEYGAPKQMQTTVTMPLPGATKMACLGRLTIKRLMPPPMPQPPL